MNNSGQLALKILTLGESGVGKTCLVNRYVDNKYDPCELSTIGIEFKPKLIVHKGYQVNLKIWDTAGQERFKNLTQQYYRNADGILLMFDLTGKKSFDKISFWIEQIKSYAHFESTPVILVGTKSDLTNSEVTDEEIESLAKSFNMPIFKTSALSNSNIKEVFEKLTDQMFENKSAYIKAFENENECINLSKKKKEEKEKKKEDEKKKKCC